MRNALQRYPLDRYKKVRESVNNLTSLRASRSRSTLYIAEQHKPVPMPSTISSSQQNRVAFVDEDMVGDKDTDEVKHKGKTEDDGTDTTPPNLYGTESIRG